MGVPCAVSQTTGGAATLQVSVRDTQGQPLAGAQVRYRRVVQTVRAGGQVVLAPGEAWVDGQVAADAGGAFSPANLPVGDYMLCASVPSAPYLDPCVWRQAVRATVSAATAAIPTLTLEKGVFLKVRINDPLRLLPQGVEGPWTPRKLLVGVMYANGAYQGAQNTGADAAGRDYQLVIPAGTAFKLWLFSTDIALTDATGNAVGTSGAQIPFQAAAGQDQVFTFTVSGLAKASPL
jgi:hypothetical protein